MKRLIVSFIVFAMISMTICSAAGETLGWGFVNDTDVALRRGIGGEKITRLPKDTCVWINDSRTDSDGVLWYEIKTGLHVDNANYDFSGWMKAEFIDAGEAIWHDVTAMAAAENGLIVLRSDGSTETAGRPIVAMDGSGWVSPRGWAAPYGRAIHVGIPFIGNQYFIVTENNELISSVNGLSVADGLSRAATLELEAAMLDEASLPVWKDDADIRVFRSGFMIKPNGAYAAEALYAGVRADGTVIAEPAYVTDLFANWSDVIDIRIVGNFALGLKKDGTVLLDVFNNHVVPDVSSWNDVIAIEAGLDWCVGLKKNGTLVFAGDHTFMNEGHSRE